MTDATRVSHLVGDIYDAALDRALWPGLLEKTCEYIGGLSAALVVRDKARQSAQFFMSWGCNPDYQKSYRDTYGRLHAAAQLVRLYSDVGHVASYLDYVSVEEERATRFYKEWAGPQGYVDAVQTTLDKSAASHAEIAVARHERHGMVDAEARSRMQLLAPHFRRAVTISKLIERERIEAAALADTLDGLAAALLLVDGRAHITYANASAEALLSDNEVLGCSAGRLVIRDAKADASLRASLTAAGGGDAAVGVQGVAIPIERQDGSRWVAHMLPLTTGARRAAGACYAAVAAVFVRKMDFTVAPLESVAKVYALTPTEMRVLLGIINVGGVPEIAPALGISESTVKTHLQRVFAKTGVNRQADLVKLAAGFVSPLAQAERDAAPRIRTDDDGPARLEPV
jgi:DNA-binding CsgD family transcriptional regulator/PAS domain-containing protein